MMKTTFCMLVCGLGLLQGQAQQSGDPRVANPSPASPAQASSPTPVASSTPPSAGADTSTAQSEISGSTASEDAALQMQIQDALSRVPTLSGSVKVTARAEGIELSGSVGSGRERLNAGRIAQSYARGRKVLNHIVVSGHNAPVPTPDQMNANHPASFAKPAPSTERD